jgi:hypothetical protein
MTDFFLRSGDEQRARQSQFLDDLDLVPSKETSGPWGPSLVAVAQRAGAHVCWYCGEQFNTDVTKHRPVEVQHGYARILLHAGRVGGQAKSFRSFEDIQRGLQARRFLTRAVKSLEKLLAGTENASEGEKSE